MLNLAIICGGALSRAVGEAFLQVLDDPDWMPLVTAGSLFPLSILCYVLLGNAPKPSPADVEKKALRRSMTASTKRGNIFRVGTFFFLISLGGQAPRVLRAHVGHTCGEPTEIEPTAAHVLVYHPFPGCGAQRLHLPVRTRHLPHLAVLRVRHLVPVLP